MRTEEIGRSVNEEQALRNGTYLFGSGFNIVPIKMNDGMASDGNMVYTIVDQHVMELEHNSETIAGVLVSRGNDSKPPATRLEFYLFAFRKDRNYFELVGAAYFGRFLPNSVNLHVLSDGEIHAEALHPDGSVYQELPVLANFFRIRI